MATIRNRFGIGPVWAVLSIIYSLAAIIINKVIFEDRKIPLIPGNILLMTGLLLILAGLIVFTLSFIDFNRAYRYKNLVTSGVYGIFRHPLYASITILIVPGSIFMTNVFFGLTVPIVMYIIFRLLIKKEEKLLEDEFGDEYSRYRKSVNAIFPKIKL